MAITVAEIRKLLQQADERELEALERSLAADTRKGVKDALAVARRRIDAERAERKRLEGLYEYERLLAAGRDGLIVGLDEVGRGPVAGPLAVGAVVLPASPIVPDLNDSKQLAPEVRERCARAIKDVALAWTVVFVQPSIIDRDGMSACLKRAFKQAIDEIDRVIGEQAQSAALEGDGVGVVLLDGNPLRIDERETNVVKGDGKCASIAAASIVAKVERDELMCALSKDYPEYGFAENKGYASSQHIEAIRTYGLTPVHRVSFCRSFMQETLF